LGDAGSAYYIALSGVRLVIQKFDECGRWPRLGVCILEYLQLNEPNDLIAWAQSASKDDLASLAVPIFNAAKKKDILARSVIEDAAQKLTNNAIACANRLNATTQPLCFIFAGGVLTKQSSFARRLQTALIQKYPQASFHTLSRESVWGAVALAREMAQSIHSPLALKNPDNDNKSRIHNKISYKYPYELIPIGSSPTEQRHPRSMGLDRLNLSDAIELMISEEAAITRALRQEAAKIEKAIRWIAHAFKHGGRLFYFGAGTSGRLGVLDASECPPTFRTPPGQVQGIIAGGQRALWQAVEGAEDDAHAGERAVEYHQIHSADVVVGIAASGRTPFVWGALLAAKKKGAKTILLAFNPTIRLPAPARPSLMLAPAIGPELLTGSTRLKSGTATKLILNMFTTLSMVQTGKVVSNLMVDVNPSNVKLRDRAIRIVKDITGASLEQAKAALEKSGWVVKKALDDF
jgi:N-acetylmuramic acid 6-phosphate etherase